MPTTRQQAKKQALALTSDSTNAPGPSRRDGALFGIDNATPSQDVAGGGGLAVQDSPIAHKVAGSNAYTSTHLLRDTKMEKLGLEMAGKLLGPMPVDLFLAEFLPCTGNTTVSENQQTSLKQASIQKAEKPMYAPLIAAIKSACKRLIIVDTHAHVDFDTGLLFGEGLKPDFAAYLTRPSRTTDFSEIEVHVEVKYSDGDDPFQDDAVPFERATKASKDTLGQITSYATAQFAKQFRTHIFSVLVFRKDARLIRWDRSGAIVTRRFNYCDTIHLLDFFRKYNDSSHEQRGVDTSVAVASGGGIAAAIKALGVDPKTPLLRFSIHDSITAADHFYIGRKPIFDSSTSPTGRHTRAFLAFDLQTEKTVFMKDTWRIDLPRLQREGDIYATLAAANVPRIAPCVLAADLQGHRTRTPEFVDAEWRRGDRPNLRPHQHYRIVLGVVGRPLTTFKSSRELVTVLRDALQAHKEAFEKARVLHRDISIGNILITDDGRGILIDWELSKHCDDFDKEARQHERTGTWQFISAMLLSEQVPHTLADDLESFLHVLTWVALRYMPHALHMDRLKTLLEEVFDAAYLWNGVVAGGERKREYICTVSISRAKFVNQQILKLLENLQGVFSYRYLEYASVRSIVTQEVFDGFQRENLAKLDDSNWMLDTFQAALDSPGWLEHDGSSRNPLLKELDPQLKRKSSNTLCDSQPPNKMQKQASR